MRRLVVLGDVLLDVDVQARAERLSPDGPAPVLDELGRVVRAGGAALAARLAHAGARDGDQVSLIAPVPDDEAGHQVERDLPSGVELIALAATGHTPVKTRLRAAGQTVARLDSGGGVEVAGVPPAAYRAIAAADAVLVSDYGGVAARQPALRRALAEAGAPVVWDPHPRGADPVPGSALVTPNLAEAMTAASAMTAGAPVTGPLVAQARQAAELLRIRWAAQSVCVTLGERGALLAYGTRSGEYFPVHQPARADACGAGDSFAAAAALAIADGALPSQAVAAAVASATEYVARGGVAALLDGEGAGDTGADPVARVRAAGGVVVATGGCFDLLHTGHVHALSAARALGDCLVVLLNSDSSARRLKGPGRPLQGETDRARVLAALRSVDAVVVFAEDTPEQALARLRPDIWVKGGDYAGSELPEAELVRSWGGEVVTVGYLDGRSSTRLVQLARR